MGVKSAHPRFFAARGGLRMTFGTSPLRGGWVHDRHPVKRRKMSSTKYLVIGGGLAAGEAVKNIRKLDADSSLTLVTEEGRLPYNRPPLSKEFLRGEEQEEDLFVSPQDFYRDNKVETILNVRAEALDAAAKEVTLSNGDSVSFEKLLIATGGSPVRLPLPGIDRDGVHYLRTMEDSTAIGSEAGPGKRAVIIGGGFIGVEVAASLTQKGMQVMVIEALPQIWPRFANRELASYVQRYCEEKGVAFSLGETVERIDGGNRVASVSTSQGRELPCDLVCVAVGLRPNVHLAESAGLKVDNGIVVDERMQCSHPDIYAAGDVANFPDTIFGRRRRVEHFGHAEYTGQIAGQNMAGGEASYDMISYVWSDIFDLHLEFAGDEAEHDQAVVRGTFEDNVFTVLYLKQGLLKAYFAVNTDTREFPVFQRFIKRGKDLSGLIGQLEDTAVNLRELL